MADWFSEDVSYVSFYGIERPHTIPTERNHFLQLHNGTSQPLKSLKFLQCLFTQKPLRKNASNKANILQVFRIRPSRCSFGFFPPTTPNRLGYPSTVPFFFWVPFSPSKKVRTKGKPPEEFSFRNRNLYSDTFAF